MGESISYEQISSKIIEEFPSAKIIANKLYILDVKKFIKSNTLAPNGIIKCLEIFDENAKPKIEYTGLWGNKNIYRFMENGEIKVLKQDEIMNYLWQKILKLEK